MNWHVESTAHTFGDLPDAIDDLEVPDATAEVAEQLIAAKDAAKALLESGAVGVDHETNQFAVELYGTANGSHERIEGQPNDRVAVAVRQVEPAPEPPAQPAQEPDGRTAESVDAEERAKAEQAGEAETG